jgi:nitrogen fixation/metabolism regulation signal transduction histidine kinase
MRWLSRITGQIKDPLRISLGLADAVGDVFDAVRCAVLLEGAGRVRIVASCGLTDAVRDQVNLEFASGLMRWFEENPCLFDRAAAGADPRAVKEMQVLGGRLAVPLMSNGRVCGALVMGEKASGVDYPLEERELFSVIARCASIAFENAWLYETVTQQQSRVDAILGNVTAGVVVVHPDKSISMINRSAERILQVRAIDLLGRSVQRLGSGFADVVLHTLADGKPRSRQEVHDPAIDATLGLSVTPMGDEGAVVIFSRLPEESPRDEDIAYSPFWEYLASRVAQEIKNPMVAINTFAQLLPRKYESADFREAFGEVVQKEVSRINNVVETLFEFARHTRLVTETSDVNETVRNVLRSFEDELASRSITLETQWTTEHTDADMDAVFFSQALHNVVQNSIDAMPEGGKLKITTKASGNGVEVLVADTGPGISEQDAPLVFTPFFSTKEQGMGLGLTVASRIMRQHEGDLRLVPDPEGGASFALRIPTTKKK